MKNRTEELNLNSSEEEFNNKINDFRKDVDAICIRVDSSLNSPFSDFVKQDDKERIQFDIFGLHQEITGARIVASRITENLNKVMFAYLNDWLKIDKDLFDLLDRLGDLKRKLN